MIAWAGLERLKKKNQIPIINTRCLDGVLKNYDKVGIIGSGSWSLALSKILINAEITIKSRDIKKAKKKNFLKIKNCL